MAVMNPEDKISHTEILNDLRKLLDQPTNFTPPQIAEAEKLMSFLWGKLNVKMGRAKAGASGGC